MRGIRLSKKILLDTDIYYLDLKDINLKGSSEMIPVYSRLNLMSFKFLFIHKIMFCASLFFNDIPCSTKLNTREKRRHEVVKLLRGFAFVLFWNLVFMCKGSQPRVYADLLRFHSIKKDSITLMKSMTSFLIHSFHVLTLAYEQEK